MKRKTETEFKGVWIPKEIWESDKLNPTEKCLLGQIYSLDNGQGCFASNLHQGKCLQLSVGTVNNILRSLRERGFLVNLQLKPTDEDNHIFRRMRVIHNGRHFYRVDSRVKYKPIFTVQHPVLRTHCEPVKTGHF